MSLSNLATELLEFIVEAVSPRDIVSFSQCSRRIRLLCTKRLAEHRELDHTTPRELEIMPLVKINNHTGNEEWSDWGYTLRAIAENRRAGWYMKNLEVVEELRQDCSNSPAGTVAISQSRLEPIWPLLRDSTYLTPHERIEWYRDMLLGQEGPLLALFLSLTPSLRWVSFEWGWRDPYIAKMLGRIATASQRCPQAALSEIPSVGVDQDTLFPDPACLTFLKTWVAVPSVVNIYIHGVILSASLNGTAEETEYLISMGEAADSHAADPATAEATSSQSGVTHLFFSKCNIESLFLSPLLRYFSNLKRVESTFSWFGSVGKVGWSPRLINETLQQYSKDTLEEFRITRDTIRPYPASFDTFISSLASFQALKTVILQFDMLIDRDPGSIQTFSSLLPLSLERLLLLNISETADTSTHITRLLSDFNCTHWPTSASCPSNAKDPESQSTIS